VHLRRRVHGPPAAAAVVDALWAARAAGQAGKQCAHEVVPTVYGVGVVQLTGGHGGLGSVGVECWSIGPGAMPSGAVEG